MTTDAPVLMKCMFVIVDGNPPAVCGHGEGKHNASDRNGAPYCSKCSDVDDEDNAGDALGYSRHAFTAEALEATA